MNAVLPLDREEGSVAGAPLLWVQQREMKVRAGATRSASWVLTVNFRFQSLPCQESNGGSFRACFLLVSPLRCRQTWATFKP